MAYPIPAVEPLTRARLPASCRSMHGGCGPSVGGCGERTGRLRFGALVAVVRGLCQDDDVSARVNQESGGYRLLKLFYFVFESSNVVQHRCILTIRQPGGKARRGGIGVHGNLARQICVVVPTMIIRAAGLPDIGKPEGNLASNQVRQGGS